MDAAARPQSVSAMTLSLPTISANVMMRAATRFRVLDEVRGVADNTRNQDRKCAWASVTSPTVV
jgi:hypothetical protein